MEKLVEYALSLSSLAVALGALVWIVKSVKLVYNRVVHKITFSIGDTLIIKPFFKERVVVPSIVILAILALFLADDNTFRELIGSHSLEGKNSGTYCYYVTLESDEESYTLPGQISVDVEVDSRLDNYGNERREYSRQYYIEKVFFPDGNCLDFPDHSDCIGSLKESILLYDQYERSWKCTILNEHAYCEQVEETSYITSRSVIELFIIIFIVLYNWLGVLYLNFIEKKKLYS